MNNEAKLVSTADASSMFIARYYIVSKTLLTHFHKGLRPSRVCQHPLLFIRLHLVISHHATHSYFHILQKTFKPKPFLAQSS